MGLKSGGGAFCTKSGDRRGEVGWEKRLVEDSERESGGVAPEATEFRDEDKERESLGGSNVLVLSGDVRKDLGRENGFGRSTSVNSI